MPISLFHTGLKLGGVNVDVEEAECYVANMIYKGYLRGYVALSFLLQTIIDSFGRQVYQPREADGCFGTNQFVPESGRPTESFFVPVEICHSLGRIPMISRSFL